MAHTKTEIKAKCMADNPKMTRAEFEKVFRQLVKLGIIVPVKKA